MNKYDDIIDLPHHVSETRPRMSAIDRAAQFSPFATLTGHNAAIQETSRLTDRFVEHDENQKMLINEKLQFLLENIENNNRISVTYYVPDSVKQGGSYITKDGILRMIDTYNRLIVFNDGETVPIEFIYAVDSELFARFEV